jgi:hypothetical protein
LETQQKQLFMVSEQPSKASEGHSKASQPEMGKRAGRGYNPKY